MNSRHRTSSLRLEVASYYEAMSRRAEEAIVAELKQSPELLLCASAGGTPTGLYQRLAQRHKLQPRLFKRMRVLQIDEWGALPRSHPATCEADLRAKLLEPLGIGRDRYAGFRTDAPDPKRECDRIARWLAANGPIDICILGLGLNGHVAMNEPAQTLSPGAHVARLTPSSLRHPMLKSSRVKPRHGLTLGLADILASRLVLLLVNGKHKQQALKQLLVPKVSTRFPASFLWLHPNACLLCDRESAPKSVNR
jgi:galactosamine-6-phosphate isomerase